MEKQGYVYLSLEEQEAERQGLSNVVLNGCLITAEIIQSLTDNFARHFAVQTLGNLRDTLLPKFMSGEIRIKH